MKRRIGVLLLTACCLIAGTAMQVRAEETEGKVEFTPENKMESDFTSEEIARMVSGVQPGDTVTFTVDLSNKNSETTDWYMTNKVLESLEKYNNDASGGAYTYRLVYTRGTYENVLYDSSEVGGETVSGAGQGLSEATHSLEGWFYLDTLSTGQSGKVELTVGMDGETEVNTYQNTQAALQLNFAVEVRPGVTEVEETVTTTDDSTSRRTTIVRTGDETNLLPFYIAMMLSGILILVLAFYSMKQGKKEKKEGK